MLPLEFLERHLAGKHQNIEREFVGPPVVVEEMYREQEAGCQHRFLSVEDRRNVEHPARQVRGGKTLEPEHGAAATDDSDAPEWRPVVELLPIGPTVELRLRRQPEKPFEHADRIVEIRQARHQRIRTEPTEGLPVAADAQEHIDDMPEEDGDEASGEEAVNVAGDARTAEEVTDDRRPGRIGEQQGHAGEHQHNYANGEGEMGDTPDRGPAPVINDLLAVTAVERLRAYMRAVLALLVITQFAVVPKCRMRPEESEHTAEQRLHEFRGEPYPRIAR